MRTNYKDSSEVTFRIKQSRRQQDSLNNNTQFFSIKIFRENIFVNFIICKYSFYIKYLGW